MAKKRFRFWDNVLLQHVIAIQAAKPSGANVDHVVIDEDKVDREEMVIARGGIKYRLEAGKAPNNANKFVDIVFNEAYPDSPVVVPTAVLATGKTTTKGVSVRNVTTTGFRLYFEANTSFIVEGHWVSVGEDI